MSRDGFAFGQGFVSCQPLRIISLTVGLLLATGVNASAQSAEVLGSSCVSVGGAPASCDAAASAASWLTAGAGLLASASSVTPDLHRTLGRREPGGPPRVGLDLRMALVPLAHPALGAGATGVVDRTQIGLGVGAAIGVFEGLQLYPGLGGVLSVDALLAYTFVRLPTSAGYESSSNIQTFGARLGLVRESFSAPGVAITVLRSLADPLIYTGEASVVNVDASTTSARLAIGKDLLGLGLHAALGRDWTSSNVRMGVPGSIDGTAVVDGTVDRDRTVGQGGISLNFLVIRVQADAGWAFGGGGPAFPGLDSEGGSLFGSLAVRLIL